MPSLHDFRVKIRTREGNCNGTVKIDSKGMSLIFDSGQVLSVSEKQDITYEMKVQVLPEVKGEPIVIPLSSPIRVFYKPFVQKYRMYNPRGGQYIEDIFPPSSSGFYGRMKSGKLQFLYIIQEIENDSRYWLTIADPISSQIHEAHFISHYEAESLSLISNQEFRHLWYETIWSTIPSSERNEILSILDGPSVSWKELTKLLRDINIPNLKLGETMRDTLSHLLPPEFPIEVQEQLMLFFALILKKDIPNEDPINYLYKFWSFPMVGALLEAHLMCLADESDWPPYLKLLTLASRKNLTVPKRAIDSEILDSPWLIFWQKTMELAPNWFNIAADVVKELNDRGDIISALPITEAAARKSLDSWKKRLAILMYEIRIVGRINAQSLGLTELVYLGAAYRWPHKHMRYITRLGSSSDNPPYLQIMIMPPSAAAQVKRVLPSIMNVNWTTRAFNIDLFNRRLKSWGIPVENIMSSIEDSCSFKRLKNKYVTSNNLDNYRITQDEAKVLDLVSDGIRLAGLERREYLEPWGLDYKKARQVLSKLSNRNVVNLFYDSTHLELISLNILINGPPGKVMSVCASFLESTPISVVMLGKNNQQAVILSRLPENPAYELVADLPRLGLEQDMIIRCFRPTTFQSYTHNLLQRLLNDDGTWNDDVSAFLSQARSKRRGLSESNA